MRYKDLITALFIVATASFIWAEPSPQVKAPTRPQQSTTIDGWTLPDLSGSSQRITNASRKSVEYSEPPVSDDPLSWSSYSEDRFKLGVSIDPGKDLRGTTFDITFRGPRGFDLVRDGGNGSQFVVGFEDGTCLTTSRARRVGPHRWTFQGADLQSQDPSKPIAWTRLSQSGSVIVTTVLHDQRQDRFSRGANFMLLESDPVRLTLR